MHQCNQKGSGKINSLADKLSNLGKPFGNVGHVQITASVCQISNDIREHSHEISGLVLADGRADDDRRHGWRTCHAHAPVVQSKRQHGGVRLDKRLEQQNLNVVGIRTVIVFLGRRRSDILADTPFCDTTVWRTKVFCSSRAARKTHMTVDTAEMIMLHERRRRAY